MANSVPRLERLQTSASELCTPQVFIRQQWCLWEILTLCKFPKAVALTGCNSRPCVQSCRHHQRWRSRTKPLRIADFARTIRHELRPSRRSLQVMSTLTDQHREPPVLSVAQLTTLIKDVLEGTFPAVWVSGELSDVSRPRSGHVYFTLKDAEAADSRSCLAQHRQQVAVPTGRRSTSCLRRKLGCLPTTRQLPACRA